MLLSIYLFSNTELYQFLKIPVLIEHYLEHKNHTKNITFSSYLNMHYSQQNDNDGDENKDMKLPFKSHSSAVFSLNFIPLITTQNIEFRTLEACNNRTAVANFYTFIVHVSYLKAIWQPPKIC